MAIKNNCFAIAAIAPALLNDNEFVGSSAAILKQWLQEKPSLADVKKMLSLFQSERPNLTNHLFVELLEDAKSRQA